MSEAYFQQKRVVVTGGSSGIGLALARRLVASGASVSLLARRADRLEQARADLLQTRPDA